MHVDNHNSPFSVFNSLPFDAITLLPGFWQQRQMTNRDISLKKGFRKLNEYGNLDNLRLAIGEIKGQYRGPQFMDSDIHKWLEAAAYALFSNRDEDLLQNVNECISLLEKVQQADGYLNSYWQFVKPGQRWTDLETGHELYCAGHLIEAGIAMFRTTGERRLLDIAQRVADNIVDTFGEGKRLAAGGHPEIELALVELYRETGNKTYLDMALFFIDQRGYGILGNKNFRFGSGYFQDRVPVREAEEVEGHAVRQLYLNSGVTDIFIETGERALMEAMQRLWTNMTGRKMYITGGFGSRHEGESFGDEFELPSDRCYCETCATIASIMWNWRMLLATGKPEYADLMERCLYNGFLSGVSLDGERYFYVNPLISRGGTERVEWFDCACCPPNVMRLIAMVQNYAATFNDRGLYIHHYMAAVVRTQNRDRKRISINIGTGYPWERNINITVSVEEEGIPWSLFLRIPAWCENTSLTVNGEKSDTICNPGTYAEINRLWHNGDRIELDLPMTPRIIEPDIRIDDIRSSLALECGPFVYCIEEADHKGLDIDDMRISPDARPELTWNSEFAGGSTVLKLPGRLLVYDKEHTGLYAPVNKQRPKIQEIILTAIPYFTWANRGAVKMRVWIPII
jgi:DUF1680 family protein